jgi:hypothetical protein
MNLLNPFLIVLYILVFYIIVMTIAKYLGWERPKKKKD